MPDTKERPLDELLFGPHAAAPPTDASLAELLSAWYRAEAAKVADGATRKQSTRTRPDTDHGKPG
jgi:hypothetical protein